ncbi:hypothetical protein FGRMN_11132 [Fusarium graminum]|nr:hypothetical protein FGRMN_11132 [Fusarium graminum]
MASEATHAVPEPLEHNGSQSITSDLSTDAFQVGFKEDLLDAITDIRSTGTFASSSSISRPAVLPIHVNGVGEIALPLGEYQARQLIAQAHQAPYGKGSDTLVDTTVRNTWELNPSQFNIESPPWTWLIRQLCDNVATSLGINTRVYAHIYKMLVYEKGAMFKAHTDTEKIPGMFGTLVVSLPSVHDGGGVILKHCGETFIYSSSFWDMSCASWYSDVSHEVQPVTSGYRWILAFNLALDQSLPPPAAGYSSGQIRSIRHCIRRWLAQDKQARPNRYVYHVLDHEYTEANVSFRSLKGDDSTRISALVEACRGLPVTFFIALLEKKEFGSVYMDPWLKGKKRRWYEDEIDYGEDPNSYHELEDIFEVSYEPKIIKDTFGFTVTNTLKLKVDDLLDEDCFEDIEAEEDYEGFMGNSVRNYRGPTATHWYRVGAVAIVPHDSIADYLGNCRGCYGSLTTPFQSQIKWLADECFSEDTPEFLATAMEQLFMRAISEYKSPYETKKPMMDAEIAAKVIQAALYQNQYRFFELAFSQFHHVLDPTQFEEVRQWIVDFADDDGKRLERFEKIKAMYVRLLPAILSSDSFDRQFQIIRTLAPLNKDLGNSDVIVPEPMQSWARSLLGELLVGEGPANIGIGDGSALVDQALYFEDPMLILTQIVVPTFEKHPTASAFRLNLMKRLRELATEEEPGTEEDLTIEEKIASRKGLPKIEAMNMYRTLARSFIASQDFACLRDRISIEASESKRLRLTLVNEHPTSTPHEMANSVDGKMLHLFFISLLEESTGLDDLAAQFMHKVTAQADKLPLLERCTMWLPLLPLTIQRSDIRLNSSIHREFFSAIVNSTIDGYVGPKPADTINYAMTGVYCGCGDCDVLDSFLENPLLKSQGFPLSKKRRQHIHQKLDRAGVRCTHQTVRTTYPETLVVTKAIRHEEVGINRWVVRKNSVLELLNQIQADHLRAMLGASFEKVDLLGRGQTSQTSAPSQPVVGDKRRISQVEAEVIDLTSD